MANHEKEFDIDAYLKTTHRPKVDVFFVEHGEDAPFDQSAWWGSSVTVSDTPEEKPAKRLRLPAKYYVTDADAAYAAYAGSPEEVRRGAATEAADFAAKTDEDKSPLQELYIRPGHQAVAKATGDAVVSSEVTVPAEVVPLHITSNNSAATAA